MKETNEVELHTPSQALVISRFVLNVLMFHLPNSKAYYYFIYCVN